MNSDKITAQLKQRAARLARNCSAWHRLLKISALSQTLILDEDGL